MILYFADRHLNILGMATTHLPEGITISNDLKTEDIETGIAVFEADINFKKNTRAKVESWAEVGNYILRSSDNENEFYNIIDAEVDTKKQKVSIYAEDEGLDLLNEVVGAYEASEYHPISYYVNKYAEGAGWEIKINEVEGLTRKLSWDSEQTASARLLDIAKAFNNCEISYSFKIKGLKIVKKYINIYEERGKDTGEQLRLNKEIDGIITSKSISNLATALQATGATPDNSEDPITLKGYEYDDGDFYIEGSILKSRKALEKWSRYLWKNDETQQAGGHIVKPFSDDTALSQAVLCESTIAELKSICDMEINYEADILELPENVKIGDRVNIIDDEGKLYLSSRVLVLETSICDQKRTAVLGEHLIRKSGISKKVEKLAAQFAKSTKSVARAKVLATNAKQEAKAAKAQAETALAGSEEAKTAANDAKTSANAAAELANTAKTEAQVAQNAVNTVEESVLSLENTVKKAQDAANNAHEAAETATSKAEEAKTAAENAVNDAQDAKTAAQGAQSSAANAEIKANNAIDSAALAKEKAEEATVTAIAAKLDSEQAEKEVAALGDKLDSVSHTMKTEYARKTDLTETTADLQTKLAQNAAKIELSAQKQMFIDETANNAATLLEAAQAAATLAQEQADEATAEAEQAQAAADIALQAANDAQAEADIAKDAYETAKSVADNAEAALLAAKKDLETVKTRADATEEEIAQAETALANAQQIADEAKTNADAAALTADNALNVAVAAVTNAEKAQILADAAVVKAEYAQANAEEAKGNAANAQAIADNAVAIATEAQETADAAKITANEAQETANAAHILATEAQETADAANEILLQANANLEDAKSRLEEVRANVDATAEEVEAAQADVATAQAAANTAKTNAEEAQAAADTAKANADTAQAAADTAKANADTAQEEAEEAQRAADEAQGFVYALAKRSIEADTKIKQTSDEIELRATKSEVQTLKDENGAILEKVEYNNSLIKQLADSVLTLVVDGSGGSLVTQTASGWTFSTTAIESAVSNTSETLGKLIEEFGSIDAAIEALKKAVGDIEAKTGYVNIGSYTYENEQGEEIAEPCIELGKSENEYKLLITNTQILFQVGSNTPTKIRSDGLVTDNITVENDFRQTNDNLNGYFVWAVRPNGNYGLQWKEGE